jgi:hypothetical protein
MRCPKCKKGELEAPAVSSPVERPGTALRHYHARCNQCGEVSWWNAPAGTSAFNPQSGPHECGFFRPQSL